MSKGDPQQRRQSGRAARKAAHRAQAERVPGRFLALPHDVILSPAFRSLSYPAVALLIDIAISSLNGRLTAARKKMKALGWKSNDVISRALAELKDRGLIVETRAARWPRQPAWYAVTWLGLEHTSDLDIDPRMFRRGLYRDYLAAAPVAQSMRPGGGPMRTSAGPSGRPISLPMRPSDGPVPPSAPDSICPPDGLNLDNAICRGTVGAICRGTVGATINEMKGSRLSRMLARGTTSMGLENLRDQQRDHCAALGVSPSDRCLVGRRLTWPQPASVR